jgi:hypothetical protein
MRIERYHPRLEGLKFKIMFESTMESVNEVILCSTAWLAMWTARFSKKEVC